MVAAGVARELLVQLSYAIGVAEPVSVYVTGEGLKVNGERVTQYIREHFDLTPAGIAKALKLKEPIYEETARYGHVGRTNEIVTKTFLDENGKPFTREVELFTWEKLDKVDEIRKAFNV